MLYNIRFIKYDINFNRMNKKKNKRGEMLNHEILKWLMGRVGKGIVQYQTRSEEIAKFYTKSYSVPYHLQSLPSTRL